MRDLDVVWHGVTALTPYARNSRTHSDEQVAQVAASIKEFGWTNPILIDEGKSIIAGHGRLQAAQRLGEDKVPTITLTGLTDAQKRAYVIADNKLALNAGWDEEMLAVEINDLLGDGFDIDLMGFDPSEIDALLAEADKVDEGLTDEDAVPDVPTEPVSKLGDIWVLGRHRVMCGDSTSIDAVDKLTDQSLADMVFTDPPYGIDYGGGRTNKHGIIKNDALEGADLGALIALAFTAKKTGADLYVCVSPLMQKPFMDVFEQNNADINAVIVWDKKNAGLGYMAYRRQCEFILFHKGSPFRKGDKSDFDLWSFSKDSTKEYVHPTQKPVAVPERALTNSSKAGDSVLDLFGGSGSTLIAAEKTGRNARLMELDPKYVDVIVKRWQAFTGKDAVHADSGQTFNEIANG
ncbi:MAG: DNA methylase N-4 [Alteromonadaceae bacterium]|nr:DNA methylase N-4 [Alteromonadaceae bacterium]